MRGATLTGVQTCAVPICQPRGAPFPGARRARLEPQGMGRPGVADAALEERSHDRDRSEERRVGKVWTFRWSMSNHMRNSDRMNQSSYKHDMIHIQLYSTS